MDALDDIVKEFLIESYESLDRLDQDLLALEEVPDDRTRLSSIFRVIHTIKGTSGFLGFVKLERITHVGESLLVLLRDGKLRLNGSIASALLAMVDAVRQMMGSIESGSGEGDNEYGDLVNALNHFQIHGGDTPIVATTVHTKPVSNDSVLGSITTQLNELNALLSKSPIVAEDETAASLPKSRKGRQRKSVDRSAKTQPDLKCDREVTSDSNGALGLIAEIHPIGSREQNRRVGQSEQRNSGCRPEPTLATVTPIDIELHDKNHAPSVSDATVRIDVNLLDKLMNLVGELVLARNQILQFSRSTDDAVLISACQRLNLITSELQEGVMKTRMQQIQNVWSKLPRVVRDLAVTCGNKKVQVKMEGAETELDKTILEAIRDPLTHIVRNSVDHGIELPEVRTAKGKPAEGTLLLRAFHEGGQVNIEISDDGGGINLARVKEKAVGQGLISVEQAATMSDRELTHLILLPGFSTAASVTNVSGRGVGMDVVKTNVEKIGGTLDIHSIEGEGTTLRIKIPLTLAIVPALMVTAGGERYAIPQNNLVELVHIEGDRVQHDVEHIHDVPVYRLRGNLLPLLYLDEQLQLRPTRKAADLISDSSVNIVVLSAEDRQFGLVVDQINDSEEIVVKPLGPHLKDISSYAGVTIMGDGAVALILDVIGIAKNSGVICAGRERSKVSATISQTDDGPLNQTLLLLGIGEQQRMAIPLAQVARLEEIPARSIERADGRQVVQYGGEIMPLIHLSQFLRSPSSIDKVADTLQVVVYSDNGRSIGLVVDHILDVVETTVSAPQTGRRRGFLGSMILQDRVTDLLDVHSLIAATDQAFLSAASSLAV